MGTITHYKHCFEGDSGTMIMEFAPRKSKMTFAIYFWRKGRLAANRSRI
jgi:hypothetical protein